MRPEKELKGFQKVVLEPGESKTITIKVPVDKLAFYDEKISDWNLEAGKFEFWLELHLAKLLKKWL